MEQPNINVGIILDEKEINFELYGDFVVKGSKEIINGKFIVKLTNDELELSGEKFSVKNKTEIFIEPLDINTCSFLLKGVTIGIKFHWEQKENQVFSGALKLLREDEHIIAINVVPIEIYLTSVISSEMSATSSIELLKAHSIISRSWLLSQIEKQKELNQQEKKYSSKVETETELIRWYDREDHTLFDVCADDHCQRYQGVTKAFTTSAKNAISETHGLVLYHNDKICDTRFSKACGGISESFENVWEPVEHEYLTSIIDYKFEPENFSLDLTNENAARRWIKGDPHAFCNTQDAKILSQVLLQFDQKTTDFFRWKVEYSQAELSELIKTKSGIDFGEILDLVPIQRGHSGRLIKLKIIGTKKTFTIGKELEIRRTLSPSHLYSSAFFVEHNEVKNNIPQRFIIYGAGWGHGVGLCQIGAAVMAEMGYAFDEILLHYFKNSYIKKIY
ncbi:MAG: SpoIID/LytB domain-containing protein [Ignavibacteriales bacterium]|nr:SpoIID/LytB domain-containing protein [Ignavibacteriales bacterium]